MVRYRRGVQVKNALIAIQVISAIVMIIAILLQPSKGNGIQGLVSGIQIHFILKIRLKLKKLF